MIDSLLQIVLRLYGETAEFLEDPSDHQLWYNRGYANGILAALDSLGFGADVDKALARRDATDIIAGHEALPWGKAYQHGFEIGARETREVMDGS